MNLNWKRFYWRLCDVTYSQELLFSEKKVMKSNSYIFSGGIYFSYSQDNYRILEVYADRTLPV